MRLMVKIICTLFKHRQSHSLVILHGFWGNAELVGVMEEIQKKPTSYLRWHKWSSRYSMNNLLKVVIGTEIKLPAKELNIASSITAAKAT